MQHRMINKYTMSLVFSLLATMTVSTAAGNSVQQPLATYSLQLAAGSTNPWALPPAPEKPAVFQRPQQYKNRQYQEDQTNIEYPGYRFVTPQILESLKQTQMQTQQVPGRYPNNYQYRSRQSSPTQLMSEQPVPGYYGFPSGGMSPSNPLYDIPAVSPWGNGPDVIYQGQSFPWVPDAAIGGIPPMNVMPFTGDNGFDGADTGSLQGDDQVQDKVFNPFTFGRNGNL